MTGINVEAAVCPRCGSGSNHVAIKGRDFLHQIPGEFPVAECDACGMWFQNPRPAADALVDLYPDDYRPHAASATGPAAMHPSRAKYLREAMQYSALPPAASGATDWRAFAFWNPIHRWHAGIDLLPRFVPCGRLLEVGCGSGARLRALRDLGWQHPEGIELVPAAVEEARAHGLAVRCGPLEEILETYDDESLDVIVSSMVLEHLPDPFGSVRRIAAKLKPGGQFLFSTVCRDGLDAKLYGKYWGGLDLPRHMAHFRRADLRAMLAGSFEHVEFAHQVAPIDFVRAATWRQADEPGRLLDRLVLAAGESKAARVCSTVLAWTGLTSRISCRCQRSAHLK